MMAWKILAAVVLGVLMVVGMPGAGVAELVAYYPLDDNANDASGYHHHGTVVQATPAVGKFGGAYYFAGNENSFITVPNSTSFNINPDSGFTMAFWVFIDPAVSPSWFSVLDYNEGWNIQGDIGDPGEPDSPRSLWFFTGINGGFEGTFATPPFGAWHHVAWKLEREGDYYALSGFLDGQSASYLTFGGTLVNGTGDLSLGKGVAAPFTGLLDEVRIYNTALSDEEILQLSQLNPVPLPNTLLLLGSGLLVLARARRFWS